MARAIKVSSERLILLSKYSRGSMVIEYIGALTDKNLPFRSKMLPRVKGNSMVRRERLFASLIKRGE